MDRHDALPLLKRQVDRTPEPAITLHTAEFTRTTYNEPKRRAQSLYVSQDRRRCSLQRHTAGSRQFASQFKPICRLKKPVSQTFMGSRIEARSRSLLFSRLAFKPDTATDNSGRSLEDRHPDFWADPD